MLLGFNFFGQVNSKKENVITYIIFKYVIGFIMSYTLHINTIDCVLSHSHRITRQTHGTLSFRKNTPIMHEWVKKGSNIWGLNKFSHRYCTKLFKV